MKRKTIALWLIITPIALGLVALLIATSSALFIEPTTSTGQPIAVDCRELGYQISEQQSYSTDCVTTEKIASPMSTGLNITAVIFAIIAGVAFVPCLIIGLLLLSKQPSQLSKK